VFLDRADRPQFCKLMRRRSPQQFVAFVILWLDGRDLRMFPLVERKRILRSQVPESGTVLYSTPVEGRGVELFAEVCANDLEGIVAKRRDGLYTPDATTWVKIKNPRYSKTAGGGSSSRRGTFRALAGSGAGL
jgi:ATP-dependent DNA ligase